MQHQTQALLLGKPRISKLISEMATERKNRRQYSKPESPPDHAVERTPLLVVYDMVTISGSNGFTNCNHLLDWNVVVVESKAWVMW